MSRNCIHRRLERSCETCEMMMDIKTLTTECDVYREGLEKIINGWGTFPTAGADVHIELNKSALQDIANVVLSKYPKGKANA